MKIKYLLLIVAGLCYCSGSVLAQQPIVKEPTLNHPEWSKPYAPFRIAGNLYYVGTYDLACYLVATTKGHILINTGLAASASQIKRNITRLGFKWKDIKILLTTQAHFDHLGAMAAIKAQTGAAMMIDSADAAVLQDGGRSDYAMGGDTCLFAPIRPDRLLGDGAHVRLGEADVQLLHHPGHTRGSCSYMLTVRDAQRSWKVLIANLPTIVTDSSFQHMTAYPHIADDYAYTLQSMKQLQFDIWVASHASQFDLHAKRKEGDLYRPLAFADRKGYDETLAALQQAYDEKMKQ